MEVLYRSSVRTLDSEKLSPVATADVTLLAPLTPSFELIGSIRNLFDTAHSDPASDAHLQDSIPQNGRTLRVGLRWKLWNR
jgi:outer membrane receptor protein involved in Fe transport